MTPADVRKEIARLDLKAPVLRAPRQVDLTPVHTGLEAMERIRKKIIADHELQAATTPPPRSTVQH